MLFKDTLKLHKALVKRFGDDLVYSVAYDEGKYYLAVSVHKSDTWEYTHGGNIQSCHIDDFNTDIRTLVNRIAALYEGVLIKRNDNNETSGSGEEET